MDPSIQYLTVAGLAAITWLGVPGAGDAALVAAAILAAQGELSISLVFLSAFVGATVGGGIGYRLGLDGGRALIVRPGPFLEFRQKTLAKGDRIFERFGKVACIVALPVMCGVNRVPLGTYIPFSTLGRLGWVLVTGGLAYVFGEDVVLSSSRSACRRSRPSSCSRRSSSDSTTYGANATPRRPRGSPDRSGKHQVVVDAAARGAAASTVYGASVMVA